MRYTNCKLAKNLIIGFIGMGMSLYPVHSIAQSPSTIEENSKTFTTYPFSDPDPVANQKKKGRNIYPYFRFDGFTDKPVQKEWKVIELENDFIKVMIMPEIGGKIWTAIDKKNGKPFTYDNDVVKFRDIAMRGPWTSGGIEINYGTIGHTPGVATPVNYITRKNADGSASCILSLLDLLTGTRWSLEVRLPKDKAYFITKSFWHNGTGIDQPYYSWMNMAQKVTDSLEYIYPGNHYITHGGESHPWPIDNKYGKNRSFYNQNDFPAIRSNHVTGVYSKYFGAYWQKEDFGMIHYAPRQDKIGKKIFIWGLSRQGMIWENILSDHAGQYMEMQSGRLYNQNGGSSVFSPFKQFSFEPYNTDTWSEYWYPFQNTGGVLFADLNGVFNLEEKDNSASLLISPVSYVDDTLKVLNKEGEIIYQKSVHLQPLQSFKQNIPLKNKKDIGKILLGKSVINLQDSTAKDLNRPLKSPSDFDWESAYGQYLRGKYLSGTRHYREAEKHIRSSIARMPYFMPALTEMAYLQYRKMNYDSARYYAKKALSIDTYDPKANYYYGLSALKLDKDYDAEDGFEIAALTPELRSAAYTELSKIKIRQQHYEKALSYAKKALINNSENITALQIQYLAAGHLKKDNLLKKIKDHILHLDPLNNFIRFEEYWQAKTADSRETFTDLIRDELPEQTYLHLAIWYYNLNLVEKSKKILEICPEKNDEILYWLAYLNKDVETNKWLDEAVEGDPHFVFPYRAESAKVMEWAISTTKTWKPEYYLALIENAHGHQTKALDLLTSITKKVDFPPLYVTRARLRNPSDTEGILQDYEMAKSLNKKDWRYAKYLSQYLMSQNKAEEALSVIKPYYKRDPDNFITGMLYVRCLNLNNKYETAEGILENIHILPYEGARDGHRLYKQIKLMIALKLLKQKKYQKALNKVSQSREWPEHLGVGKPYTIQIKDGLQNAIQQLIEKSEKNHSIDENRMDFYLKKVKELGR